MGRRRIGAALAALALLAAASAAAAGCHATVTGATPKAQAALTADAVVVRVNELQATVIDACGPAPQCQPGSLSTATARDIVQTCLDLRAALRAAPNGWQATVRAAWASARARFGAVTNPAIVAALAAVDAAIGGL